MKTKRPHEVSQKQEQSHSHRTSSSYFTVLMIQGVHFHFSSMKKKTKQIWWKGFGCTAALVLRSDGKLSRVHQHVLWLLSLYYGISCCSHILGFIVLVLDVYQHEKPCPTFTGTEMSQDERQGACWIQTTCHH